MNTTRAQFRSTTVDGAKLPPLLLVRGTAVAMGPSILLDLLVAGGTLAVVSGWIARQRRGLGRVLRPVLAAAAAFPWVYCLFIRPWHRRWGASDEEVRMRLPGDDLVPDPGYENTRAVTIRAPAAEVWRWVAQLGQGRGGFYSYDWLENLAGCDIHSADRVHPEWQDPRPGDTLALMQGWGPKLAAVESGEALVIEGWGTYAVRPINGSTARLIARARQPRGLSSLAYRLTVEIPHFIMERKMLLGIKERAERAAGGGTLLDEVLASYDYRGSVSTTIRAPREEIFRSLREVTLAEMPLAYALGSIRYLPGRLAGRMPARPDELRRPFFEAAMPLILAEEPGREVVIGSIGKLHDLVDQQFVDLGTPGAFRSFYRPDYEKFVQSFRISGGDEQGGYHLLAEHRTRVLGRGGRWKFALYWYLMVGWAGNLLLDMLLAAVKRRAERVAASTAGTGSEEPDVI